MNDMALEQRLLARLNEHEALKVKGYAADLDEHGNVMIHRDGDASGIWRSVLGVLHWTPTGYNGPLFQVADVDAAVWHTLIALGLKEPRR
jgi:hypothetical protein